MAESKTIPIKDALRNLTGGDLPETAVAEGRCLQPPIGCGRFLGAHEFRDQVSAREYRISGLCQRCQDEVFG